MEQKQCSICGEFYPETMIVTVGYPKSDRGGSVQCRNCFDYDQEFVTRYPLSAIFTEFYKTLLQNQVIASSFDILVQLDVLYKTFRSKIVNKEFDLQRAAQQSVYRTALRRGLAMSILVNLVLLAVVLFTIGGR